MEIELERQAADRQLRHAAAEAGLSIKKGELWSAARNSKGKGLVDV